MNDRFKSLIATVLINAILGYGLFIGLSRSFTRQAQDKMAVVNVAPVPPPKIPPPPGLPVPAASVAGHDWAAASPAQRNVAFIVIQKWIKENTVSEEDKRLDKWRQTLPQGSGPGKVTRLRPPNLTTHTVYWPALWSKGPLPIIAWGNGYYGMCSNTSLPYAAFLSEVASYGYFVVAVGNDDIDYPLPEGMQILADGRHVETPASALKQGVDWAIAENSRPGSPYYGKIDTSKIAYMGQGCGAQQAMSSSYDPRTTTTVVLNAGPRFHPGAPDAAHKASLAQFSGGREDSGSILDVADANFANAQGAKWPMYKAALDGMNHNGAYAGPDKRWSKAIIAWLDLQLKGNGQAATVLNGLGGAGWSRVDATGVAMLNSTGKETRIAGQDATAITRISGGRSADAPALPEVPASQVQVVPEGKVYVLRNLVDDTPLYTFDKDEAGKSNCVDACAAAWRPLAAPGDAEPVGKWTVVKRNDGTTQWAYEGKPVYSFARDPEPVATSKGMGAWHLLPTFPAG